MVVYVCQCCLLAVVLQVVVILPFNFTKKSHEDKEQAHYEDDHAQDEVHLQAQIPNGCIETETRVTYEHVVPNTCIMRLHVHLHVCVYACFIGFVGSCALEQCSLFHWLGALAWSRCAGGTWRGR